MTFERDNRTSQLQRPLWRMDLDSSDRSVRNKRRLIVEPYALQGRTYPAELRVWIEEDTPQYCYVVESIMDKPKGTPTFRIESVAIENSRRSVPAKTGLESVVIEALVAQQLIGESANSALYNLFWTHFVLDDDGLAWLHKHASKETGNYYASQRLAEYTRAYDNDKRGTYEARRAVEKAMDHDSELGERMAQRVVEDEAFQHAIEALMMTEEDEDTQHANVRRIVELNVTDKDLVFAAIVGASRSDHAFRGLRACQRAERDPAFFEAVAAIARHAHTTTLPMTPSVRAAKINSFLHKSRKTL